MPPFACYSASSLVVAGADCRRRGTCGVGRQSGAVCCADVFKEQQQKKIPYVVSFQENGRVSTPLLEMKAADKWNAEKVPL